MRDPIANRSNMSSLGMISDYGGLHTTPARRHVSVYSRTTIAIIGRTS